MSTLVIDGIYLLTTGKGKKLSRGEWIYRGQDLGGAHTFVPAQGMGLYKCHESSLANLDPQLITNKSDK